MSNEFLDYEGLSAYHKNLLSLIEQKDLEVIDFVNLKESENLDLINNLISVIGNEKTEEQQSTGLFKKIEELQEIGSSLNWGALGE